LILWFVNAIFYFTSQRKGIHRTHFL